MDLTAWLGGLATRGTHVLVVEAPGGWPIRCALERAAVQRGWSLAVSPPDADVLAVCGVPGPEIAQAVEQVWDQLPGPRARLDLASWEGPQALDEAGAVLRDAAHQKEDARSRRTPEPPEMDHGGMDHGEMDHGEMDHGEMDHGGMDHEGMDHEGMDHEGMDHGDMDHGDMEMAPHGIPLAEGGDDRDGLEMDVLHVTLGPVLPHWPAGLALRCALQGDVVTEAEARWIDAHSDSSDGKGEVGGRAADDHVPESKGLRAAHWCDDASHLLALVGSERLAAQGRSVRDELMSDPLLADPAARLDALQRRVANSRMLRWSLRGIGVVATDFDAGRDALPAEAVGDAYDRLLVVLRRAQAELGDGTSGSADPPGAVDGVPLEALASTVTGLDLAGVRLVVASLAPLLHRQGAPTHA